MTSWKRMLGSLALLLGMGCGAEVFSEETADQALVLERVPPRSNTLFFGVRMDVRRCAAPACGGSFVRALNSERTTCVDGSKAAECYVADLDLRRLGLSGAQTEQLTRERGRLVLRGAIRPSPRREGLGSLEVEEAWRGVNDTAADATLLTTSTGILCVAAPCPTHQGVVVNQGRRLKLDPNRAALQATQEDVQRMNEAFHGEGVLLSGRLTEANVPPTGVDALFEVTQAYLRISDAR